LTDISVELNDTVRMNITLMMKVVSSSAMSVIAYQTTQWNIPEDSHLQKGYCLKMGLKEEKSQNHSPLSVINVPCFRMASIGKNCILIL
jgi:Na+-translocating ferredoxin:NAD+ oxidoreductase RnfG subunit